MSNFTDIIQAESDSDSEEQNLEPWAKIQQDTFSKWINEKIKDDGLKVSKLWKDLKDGVVLCKVMEALKGGKIGKIIQKKKIHQIEACGNLALALEVMKRDGVRLVNIGPSDIRSGNLKLILGMLWTMIRRYQIGSSGKLPPKKLMLSWCNAVLHPHLTVNNFSADWNDGIALHGIIEYCKPGTCPGWFNMGSSDWEANCANALRLAEELFSIPDVISAANMASPNLDDLSGMTYLSFFMAENTPGYKATMDFVLLQISPNPVTNFQTDWNNGYIFSSLVHSLGGNIPGWPNIDTSDWAVAIQKAITASQTQLRVEPVITAKDMSSANVDHIGVMAYAAWHQAKATAANNTEGNITYVPPSPPITENPAPAPPPPVAPPPPSQPSPPESPRTPSVVLVPIPKTEPTVIFTDTMPRRSEVPAGPAVAFSTHDNWRSGCTSTIEIDTTREGPGDVSATAGSPSGIQVTLDQAQVDKCLHHLSFIPEEKGQWILVITHNEQEIQGSPFPINVYDPSDARIQRSTDTCSVQELFTFDVDISRVGLQDIDVFVVYDGERIDYTLLHKGEGVYKVSFLPASKGVYNVSVFSGGDDISGSPFKIKVEDREEGMAEEIPISTQPSDIAVESSLTELDRVIEDAVLEGPSPVRASGRGLFDGLTHKQTDFTLDTSADPDKKISVSIKGASGCEVDYKVAYLPGDQLRIQYSPLEQGIHTIDIAYDGRPITGSPYHPAVKEGIVLIRELETKAKAGVASSFKIDASEVKKGTLEIDSDLPIHKYDKLGHNCYQITFIAMKPGFHDLIIKYNGEIVPGCPYQIEIEQ